MKLENFLQKTISWLFAVLFFLVPLFFLPFNYELFEFNKIILVYLLSILITASWIGRMIIQKRLILKKTYLDIPLLVFFLSQVLSTIFSIDPHTSFFGYYSRFNGGLLSIISYLALYWTFVSNCEKKDVFRIIKASFLSAIIVSIYGIFEHFGHSFSCLMFGGKFDVACWVQDVKNRVFATLGQPNWLAAYLVALTPSVWQLISTSKTKDQHSSLGFQNINYFLYFFLSGLFFSCLLFTQSRSGFLAFIFVFGVFFLISLLLKKKDIKILVKPLFFLIFELCALIFIFGSPFPQINKILYYKDLVNKPGQQKIEIKEPAGPALEVGGTESGKIRQIVWKGAINVFKHYPVFGSGVETFAYSYYNFRPVEHNLVSEWDFLYNKAHNEYLNYLSTTGLLGLASYLLFIGFFIVKNLAQLKDQMLKIKNIDAGRFDICILSFALFSGWLSILITNFFGFSVVLVSLLFYLIPAFNFVLQNNDDQIIQQDNKISKYQLPFIPLTILSFVTIYLLLAVINLWRADFFYSQGQKLAKQSEYVLSYQEIAKAADLSPSEPVFLSELSSSITTMALLSSAQEATASAEELAVAAVSFSDRAIKISPRNLNLWKARIKVFYTLSLVNKKYFPGAVESTLEAIRLSPTDPKLIYNLGLLYGSNEEIQKALDSLKTALELKPNYEEARNSLAIFYEDLGQKDKALEQLNIILQGKPNDLELKDRIENLKK